MFKNKNPLKLIVTTVAVVALFAAPFVLHNSAFASSLTDGINAATDDKSMSQNDVPTTVKTVIRTLMYVVGIISIIVIVVAGIMYIIAAGDESKIKKAKGAIVGGLIGLVVAILAWTITNFVITALI